MASIFISHAVADVELAKLFTDFLKQAIGVPHKEIFCSSVEGHGVPMTEDFNKFMKEKIEKPKLVLLLMTPAYMESAFCLMELGASWALTNRSLPIVVPPVAFSDVTRTLGLVQAWDIEKASGIIELRSTVKSIKISLEARHEQDWENKKNDFIKSIKKTIKKLPGATKVEAATYKKALDKIDQQTEKIAKLERLVSEKDSLIVQLQTAKDPVAVKAIMQDAGHSDSEDEFQSLLGEVINALPSVARVVKLHIIMDHYNKASQIDWYNDREDFNAAVQKNLIENEPGNPVLWKGNKLKKLLNALQALDQFSESYEGNEYLASNFDGLNDISDIDFWEEHL